MPWPYIEPIPWMVKGPLRHNPHNSKAITSYSVIDDLTQSPSTISALEVLQTCPTQWKSILYELGAIDPSDSRLMAFDLDNASAWLPPIIAF